MKNDNFAEFVASCESMNLVPDLEDLSHSEQVAIGSVYGNVKEFLVQTNLAGDQVTSIENFGKAVESFNTEVALTDIGADDVQALCKSCGIPDNQMRAAVESVGLCIHNYTHGYSMQTHFEQAAPSVSHGNFEMKQLSSIYSDHAMESLSMTPKAAVESFGAYTDNTITDAKVAITVSILRFHRSALHRIIPNIPTNSNVVTFKVDNMEVYDLTKSRDSKSSVRNDGDHRIPFVELYKDPSPANATLKPILLHTANDPAAPGNKLIDENIAKIGVEVNMFDYSVDPGVVGYNHIDYTDLVGDNVRIKALYIEIDDGTVQEMVTIPVITDGGARMNMNMNNQDSSDRTAALNGSIGLDNTTAQSSGVVSTILAGLTADAYVGVAYNASGQINLKTSNVIVHGSIDTDIKTKSGNAVIAGDQTIFDGLTIKMVGYEIDAHFSEENIRKTTRALRILTKQFGYEIPGSANNIVQYSLTQSRPETVIDGLTKMMSVGIDDRGINLILDTLQQVKDRIVAESAFGSDVPYTKRIGCNFVAGQRVKPYIYTGNIDITNSISIRDEDRLGDVRSYAEKYLLEVLTRIHNESYYQNELGNGEKAVFNVLTSGWIKDALLSVPHYHDHLRDTAKDAVSDGAVEFRRTMSNGNVLNVMTTTFNYMTDKMIIIPVRANSPRSTLNFAQNLERGTYVTQATPSVDSAIYNQLISNAREFPIVLNPVGALLTVSGLTQVFQDAGGLGL